MERVGFFSKWLLRIGIVLAAVYDLIILNWVGIAGGALILLSTFLIDYLNKDKKVISDGLTAIYCIYCIFALVFGVMLNFYDKISWWDILMHLMAGFILGIFANAIINKQFSDQKPSLIIKFMFLLGFAAFGGVIWEIYEFLVDLILNLDTQLVKATGAVDIMSDLIADLIGGALSGIYFSGIEKYKK